ncbi:PIG-P-domain-containing protein [Fistulina hepatica ATCC 64428]|uniref:PIG-P-domain-containing protein n=1 Tax=Fistulina hepatica ATCC 64428 TaxID=1128425 RepID=A0A0D7AA62_9AGAR|nr:PIG-P-domain-containing protein [Fistulina hepatica ATCC 64428]
MARSRRRSTLSVPESPVAAYPARSRATEFYGFIVWTSTSFLFILYVMWGFFPDNWILAMGIEWYPSREWAILLPAYSIMAVLFTYFVYFSLALFSTPAFSDLNAVFDSRSQYPDTGSAREKYLACSEQKVLDLYDIPLGMVNRAAYSRQRPKKKVDG